MTRIHLSILCGEETNDATTIRRKPRGKLFSRWNESKRYAPRYKVEHLIPSMSPGRQTHEHHRGRAEPLVDESHEAKRTLHPQFLGWNPTERLRRVPAALTRTQTQMVARAFQKRDPGEVVWSFSCLPVEDVGVVDIYASQARVLEQERRYGTRRHFVALLVGPGYPIRTN